VVRTDCSFHLGTELISFFVSVIVETGPQAAAASYKDVCTRTLTINEMIQNPRMMVMLGLSNFDFGTDIQERSTLVKEALFGTKEH
jgi:hypothetical protein